MQIYLHIFTLNVKIFLIWRISLNAVTLTYSILTMEIELVKINSLSLNTGQIEGVPANPRLIKDPQYKRLLKSIQDDPEFMTYKPLYVFNNIVIGGNMRLRACKELKWKEIPIMRIPEDTPIEKIKAFIVKDNSHYGENDWDAFANEWSDSPLVDWGAMKTDYNSSFEPNLSPETSEGLITDDDIAKTNEKLNGAFAEGHTQFLEVCCPKCAHVFDIKKP